MSPGVRWFGRSIHGVKDLGGDRLADVVVGAEGQVIVLSSRPVVDIVTELSFSPDEIPVHEVECSYSASQEQKEGVKLKVCFQIRPLTSQFQGQFRCAPRTARQASLGRFSHHSSLAFLPA